MTDHRQGVEIFDFMDLRRYLRAYYDDWDDMGSAYLRAKNAWLEARSLDTHDGTEARVDQLRAGPWKVVPFDLPLPG